MENAMLRAEMLSGDPWVRRWRPFFGYTVAISWGVQSIAIAIAILLAPQTAAPLLVALGEGTATQWSIALAVLGVGIWARSRDKNAPLGQPPASVLGRVIAAVRDDRANS
jgi:hypothetical protein